MGHELLGESCEKRNVSIYWEVPLVETEGELQTLRRAQQQVC